MITDTRLKGTRATGGASLAGQAGPLSHEGDGAEGDRRLARLVRAIEGEIVPRLIVARREASTHSEAAVQDKHIPEASDVEELVRVLLAHDVGVASAFVETVRERGATLDAICVALLAPAARELGALWERDECDFMQVTLALCRLHQVLRELSSQFRGDEPERRPERRILLGLTPGEQHTFGLSVIAESLDRAGWEVWQEFPSDAAQILTLVRKKWFAVVGLSVGSDLRIHQIAAMIRAIRAASINRAVGILVGGPALLARPELVSAVKADATAADGAQTVLRAEEFVAAQATAG